jgi:nicotinate-nucleotide adenylyltransferase
VIWPGTKERYPGHCLVQASKDKNFRKIGIMGGTFDPIHYGHLVTAEAARAEFELEDIIFVPSGHPPHKEGKMVTPGDDRYLMTVLATITNLNFKVSRIELDREGPTYAVDTLAQFRQNYGDDVQLYFITGADAILEIFTWKNVPELFSYCHFIAATRPGYSREKLNGLINTLQKEYSTKVYSLDVPALAISSTDIRERVRTGRPIKYLLPEAVQDYIVKRGLYKE